MSGMSKGKIRHGTDAAKHRRPRFNADDIRFERWMHHLPRREFRLVKRAMRYVAIHCPASHGHKDVIGWQEVCINGVWTQEPIFGFYRCGYSELLAAMENKANDQTRDDDDKYPRDAEPERLQRPKRISIISKPKPPTVRTGSITKLSTKRQISALHAARHAAISAANVAAIKAQGEGKYAIG